MPFRRIRSNRNALEQWNHRRRNRHRRLQSHPKRQTRQTTQGLCEILSQVAESNPPTGLGRWTSGRDMYASKAWLKRHPGRNYISTTKPKQWILHSVSKLKLIVNIWTKFSNMVLLGDFSTNLLQDERGDTSYEGNKMKSFQRRITLN